MLLAKYIGDSIIKQVMKLIDDISLGDGVKFFLIQLLKFFILVNKMNISNKLEWKNKTLLSVIEKYT